MAEVRLPGRAQPLRVRVRNLSASGLMAEGMVTLDRGTQLEIEIRNVGWVAGEVAWAQEGRFGVIFTEEIDPNTARQAPSGVPDSQNELLVIRPRGVVLKTTEPDPRLLRRI